MRSGYRLLYEPFFFSSLIFLLMLGGCGYSLHRHSALPFTEIGLGRIENKTTEPKLQDKLHRALTEELLKQGLSLSPSAGRKLTGVINNFDMVSLSEKGGIAVEYRVIVHADFRLTDNKGTVQEIKNISSPFIVSFAGAEDLGRLLAVREAAEERAVRDIAMEVVGALIYK